MTAVVDGMRVLRLRANGSIRLREVTYMIDGQLVGQDMLVIEDGDSIVVVDLEGAVLIEHTRPAPGVKYAGNGRPRGRRPRNVTDVLRHHMLLPGLGQTRVLALG